MAVRRGLPSRTKPIEKFDGFRWDPSNLRSILKDEAICGILWQEDYVMEIPAIITVAEHKAIVKLMQSRAHHHGVRHYHREMLVSVLVLMCGYCGRPMHL